MNKKSEKIKDYWDSQAEKHKGCSSATSPDDITRELEIKNIFKHLLEGKKILDVGCGNGYSTIRLAKMVKSKFIGCDFSKKMIQEAGKALKKEKPTIKKNLGFVEADVLDLPFKDRSFDIVISDRCLINLTGLKHQVAAAKEISRVLKKKGFYIMCENTQEGLESLNKLRKIVNLYPISCRWHNLYINEKGFFAGVKNFLILKTIDNFSSTYYLASRVFNGKIAALEGKNPDYYHPINQIAAKLPAVGDYGPLKIFILVKK